MVTHCGDNETDRKLGRDWERRFCHLAAERGLCFTPHQINHHGSVVFFRRQSGQIRRLLLPDVTIWSSPGQHHEIKHKQPARNGCFGLEVYRFESLLWFARETGQEVFYTIHNHALAGGRNVETNDIAHWVTVNVLELDGVWKGKWHKNSYVNGETKRVAQYYWPAEMWMPLKRLWESCATS